MINLQVGVKAFLRNEEGKFLLVHRNFSKYGKTAGSWDIVGGRINPGTRLTENLRREIREETGLEITSEPNLICAQDILPSEDRHIVRLTYTANCQGILDLDKEEHDEYKWLSLDEIKNQENLDEYVKEIIVLDIIF